MSILRLSVSEKLGGNHPLVPQKHDTKDGVTEKLRTERTCLGATDADGVLGERSSGGVQYRFVAEGTNYNSKGMGPKIIASCTALNGAGECVVGTINGIKCSQLTHARVEQVLAK